MLALGVVCLILGCWSLIQWDLRDTVLGVGFFVLSLIGARRRWRVPA
jgi:hypothetical protein